MTTLHDLLNSTIELSTVSSAFSEAKNISNDTSTKEYRILMRNENATSYSKLGLLHKCPRLYEIESLRSQMPTSPDAIPNADFAFGHSVGAGIQTLASTGSLQAALLAAFLAWKIPYDFEKLDWRGAPAGKSIDWAFYAVEKFQVFLQESELSEWEVLRINGKPATELSFALDCENGFFHFGHIDTILQNKRTGKLAVWEGKTTGMETVEDSAYGNSYQALGYSVVVDSIAESLGLPCPDYEVFYVVYSSKTREFQLLTFTKTNVQRAEWLQDLLLTHATISKYRQLQFFPKRGEACLDKWGKTCQHYGSCGISNQVLFPKATLQRITSVEQIKNVDYKFTISELVASQRVRA